MKQLTVLLIVLGFLFGFEQAQSQTKKKEKNAHKSQLAEWKEARNGAVLSVKWKLRVKLVFSDYAVCYVYVEGKPYDTHGVRLYDWEVAIHADDIIIATGQTGGVSSMGEVILSASNVVNKGVE